MSWWATPNHQQNAAAYNAEWGRFFGDNPNPGLMQIMSQGKAIMQRFGQTVPRY